MGHVYELHPDIRKKFDLLCRTSVAVINMTALLSHPSSTRLFTPIPQYPEISYDITVELSSSDRIAPRIRAAEEAKEFLRSIDVVDIFDAESSYNVTLRCTYGSDERTLTEEEVQEEHADVVQKISG